MFMICLQRIRMELHVLCGTLLYGDVFVGKLTNNLQTCVLEMNQGISEQGSEVHFARRHASKAF